MFDNQNVIDLIYVSSGRHKETEALIRKATGSLYAHAAVGLWVNGAYRILEAVRPAVRFSPADIFDGATELEIISIEVTPEQQRLAVEKAIEIVGQPYGVDDCLIGGAHDLMGERVADLLDKILDNPESFNCSSTQTVVMRTMFEAFNAKEDESKITPEAARKYAREFVQSNGLVYSILTK